MTTIQWMPSFRQKTEAVSRIWTLLLSKFPFRCRKIVISSAPNFIQHCFSFFSFPWPSRYQYNLQSTLYLYIDSSLSTPFWQGSSSFLRSLHLLSTDTLQHIYLPFSILRSLSIYKLRCVHPHSLPLSDYSLSLCSSPILLSSNLFSAHHNTPCFPLHFS